VRVKRGFDRTSLVAGLSIAALGALLLLDRTGVIDLGFGYAAPAVTATLGAILLAAGLQGPRRR
jgi:hypothetical protein